MAAWTNATATDAGVLRPADGSGITPVYRPPAGATVSDFVERYWSVDWATDQPTHRQVLSHPTFHLAVSITPRAADRPATPR